MCPSPGLLYCLSNNENICCLHNEHCSAGVILLTLQNSDSRGIAQTLLDPFRKVLTQTKRVANRRDIITCMTTISQNPSRSVDIGRFFPDGVSCRTKEKSKLCGAQKVSYDSQVWLSGEESIY